MKPLGAPRIDIVVPVHGGWEHVRECLQSLRHQTINVNVIVVDDASPDDTLMRIREEFGEFAVLANEQNKGFAYTCNRGIRHGDSPFVLLLNSDVVAERRLAEDVVSAFDRDVSNRAGSVSAALANRDGALDAYGITVDDTGFCYVRYHDVDCSPDLLPDRPTLVGPYGAIGAYRRRALNDVGLLDENIFMYGEDLDLALRLRAADWETIRLPVVIGRHIGGASAGNGSHRQRSWAGFGRGYILRVYRLSRGRRVFRVLALEGAAVLAGLIRDHDLVYLRSLMKGWRAGGVPAPRRFPGDAVDASIGIVKAVSMRRRGYWKRLLVKEADRATR